MQTQTAPGGRTDELPPRLLRRNTRDGVLGGVCAGIGRYFGIDPVLVRLVAVVFGVLGPGIPAYLVAWVVIPSDNDEVIASGAVRAGTMGAAMAGFMLVAAGIAWAIHLAVPALDDVLWPVVLVAAGVTILAGARR